MNFCISILARLKQSMIAWKDSIDPDNILNVYLRGIVACKKACSEESCKNLLFVFLAAVERWPQGNYGIVSREKCPKGWFEFTHCQDTENNNNEDNYANFELALTENSLRCDGTSFTIRYCFKGPEIETRQGGFWTKAGKDGSAFVIRNVQGDCSVFGGNGGSVDIDNEDSDNKNAFGNSGLNAKKYNNYYPRGFKFGRNTHLEFCKIGGPKSGALTDYIEIGEFNQKFGFFVVPGQKCPKLKSPHGILKGSPQNFSLDDEDNNNENKMDGGAPVNVGRNSKWSVCVYDPTKGKQVSSY